MSMIPVTCAIILHGGRVLATQRSERMHLPLKWEFPGGKVHEGESEEDCIVREIREELGIDIELVQRLTPAEWDYGTFAIRLIPFIARYTGGIIQLAEHRDAQWLTRNELGTLDWAPADLPILNELLATSFV
jgi:8-oxo-dGTP diphosphatase